MFVTMLLSRHVAASPFYVHKSLVLQKQFVVRILSVMLSTLLLYVKLLF
jgi:hypothetical protein